MKRIKRALTVSLLAISAHAHSGVIEAPCLAMDSVGLECITGSKGSAGKTVVAPNTNQLDGIAAIDLTLLPPPAFDESSPAYEQLIRHKGSPFVAAEYASCSSPVGGVACSGIASIDEASSVPAPAPLALIAAGLAGLLTQRRSGWKGTAPAGAAGRPPPCISCRCQCFSHSTPDPGFSWLCPPARFRVDSFLLAMRTHLQPAA